MPSAGSTSVVIIFCLVASAASCPVAKKYSTRVFKPASPQKRSDSTATALKFMQFDNENPSDSIDMKDLAIKEPESSKDTTAKVGAPVIENKEVVKNQPIDATKRGATRNKKVRQ